MPLKGDATLLWHDRFTKKTIGLMNPTHVKVSARWCFVAGPEKGEDFWCKIHLFGAGNRPMVCSIDNDLDHTAEHGLAVDERIEVRPAQVAEVLVP